MKLKILAEILSILEEKEIERGKETFLKRWCFLFSIFCEKRYHLRMKYYTKFKVRTYECDSYGHVNNANYLNYLEFGRMDYLQQAGFDYQGCVKAGFYLYVTHVDIYYKASAFFDDELTIETEPVKIGAVSGQIHQIIRKNDGTVCTEADVTWASVNSSSGRPARLPAEFMVAGLNPEYNK